MNVFCSSECVQQRPANSSRLYWHRCGRCDVVLRLSHKRLGGLNFCDGCRAESRRDINRRKNAKRRGAGSGGYSLIDVGERDGWRCHLCGRHIDRQLSGNDERGPTIDHLVPVSSGGRDVLENVALAHRRCNVARGNRGEVQLRLLG